MRDLFVTAVVFGSLPFILRRPWFGIIMWCWISYMNPHRICWGFAVTFPFAMIIALATLAALMLSREAKKIPWTRETIVLVLFVCWMVVSTRFAFYPDEAWPQLERSLKIELMIFVTLMLITTRQRLEVMIWVIVLSIGYYGVKGGIFTILHGGQYHIYGPPDSFISGNNELAVGLIMTIPLMRFLQLTSHHIWVRYGLTAAMLLSAVAAIGSQSRGALLGLIAMSLFLWLKGRKKFSTALLIGVAALVTLSVMPPSWYERMGTIQAYEQDGSAMGRINAWWCAWNVAKARPLIGGGFEAFKYSPTFDAYAPDPDRVHDVHNIYFQVLGEQGFVGFALFLLLGIMTWRTASSIIRSTRGHPATGWMADLARIIQVSFVGYGTGGAFLGLAYFDLPYHLVAAAVIMKTMLLEQPTSPESLPDSLHRHDTMTSQEISPGLMQDRSSTSP